MNIVKLSAGFLLTATIVSCGTAPAPSPAAGDTGVAPDAATVAATRDTDASASAATAWPSSLVVLGDGYPRPGDACRRVGESAATVDYLDDSAQLVGCPTADAAAVATATALGGREVGKVDGPAGAITLISVPQGRANANANANANAGMAASGRSLTTEQSEGNQK